MPHAPLGIIRTDDDDEKSVNEMFPSRQNAKFS